MAAPSIKGVEPVSGAENIWNEFHKGLSVLKPGCPVGV
jgi:hypothetical protein